MAQQTHITLIDDLNGGEATETVTFGLDGTSYEIDLSTENAKALRKALADYVTAGRWAAPPKARRSASGRRNSAEIRAWAKERGLVKSNRGRIPADVVRRYESRG